MRKFRSIVKKQSTYSKTLCFLKLNFETGVYICVSYDTYDDIENDVFSIYRYVGSKIDTIKCQRSKAAKKILEMSKN